MLALLFVFSSALSANELYLDYALLVKNDIFKRLRKCHLYIHHVQDEFLNVPADRIISAPSGLALARFKQWGEAGANRFEWKNPNGGFVHSINQGYERMSFVVPELGTVAIVNQYTVPSGRQYNYLCRSRYVDFGTWKACVKSFFTDVVFGKLCRFGLESKNELEN